MHGAAVIVNSVQVHDNAGLGLAHHGNGADHHCMHAVALTSILPGHLHPFPQGGGSCVVVGLLNDDGPAVPLPLGRVDSILVVHMDQLTRDQGRLDTLQELLPAVVHACISTFEHLLGITSMRKASSGRLMKRRLKYSTHAFQSSVHC